MPPTRRSRRRNNYYRNANVVSRRTTSAEDEMVVLEAKHRQKCMFCGYREIDETKYGPMYKLNDVVVHYFCILLSSMAVQNGNDEEGIWGFLLNDIHKELKRGSSITCCYCKQTGATIGCCARQCRRVFHLPCGLKNGSMHQFFQSFKSFCEQHRITQIVDISVLNDNSPALCAICKESVIPKPLPNSLWAPCCKSSWFHRKCIQDMALNAGYFFKCPLCNNVEKFKFRMLTHGIYIPSRDASWETVPNAFAELLDRPNSCSALKCLCPLPEGRNGSQETGSWNIVLCCTCGSCGVHMLCGNVQCDLIWNCDTCSTILTDCSKNKRRKIELSNGEPDEEQQASTSKMAIERLNASSSGFKSEEPTASTSRLIHRQLKSLSGGAMKVSSSRSINELAEVSSSSGLSNGYEKASISRMMNGGAEAHSSGLSCRHARAFTNGLSNGHAVVPTSRFSNVRNAEASTSSLINRQNTSVINSLKNRQASSPACSSTTERANASASGSTNGSSRRTMTSTPVVYNLRRSSRNVRTTRDARLSIDINFHNNETSVNGDTQISSSNQSQNSRNKNVERILETIVISDSDEDNDDVQVVTYIEDAPLQPPKIVNRMDPGTNGSLYPPLLIGDCRSIRSHVHLNNVVNCRGIILESVDLTLDDD